MATDAVLTSQTHPRPTASSPTYRPVNRTAERIFFSAMAILLCIVVYIGFSPT